MINAIKRKLEEGEIVELECIDKDGFINNAKRDVKNRILSRESIIVNRLSSYTDIVYLEEGPNQTTTDGILPEELEYFKIKENKKTFYDLVDAVVQAKKDGVVSRIEWDSKGVLCAYRLHDILPFVCAGDGDSSDFVEDAIKTIRSCYTETFVIEREEDISKVKSGAEVVLTNGSRGIAESQHCHLGESFLHVVSGDYSTYLYLFTLKGATVTQRKINN